MNPTEANVLLPLATTQSTNDAEPASSLVGDDEDNTMPLSAGHKLSMSQFILFGGLMVLLCFIVGSSLVERTTAVTYGSSSRPLLETPQGTLRGLRFEKFNFFGDIPYAKPPVEELRWQPPVDLLGKTWEATVIKQINCLVMINFVFNSVWYKSTAPREYSIASKRQSRTGLGHQRENPPLTVAGNAGGPRPEPALHRNRGLLAVERMGSSFRP